MASNYTSNYNLCQWEASDKVLRAEFNEDNAKIDAALASKASVTEMNRKADKSALNALQSTVTAQMPLRNCRFVTGSYTGSGKYGASSPTSFTFSHKPVFLCVLSGDNGIVLNLIREQNTMTIYGANSYGSLDVSWGDRSVSWYIYDPSMTNTAAALQMNARGTYHYFAILELD